MTRVHVFVLRAFPHALALGSTDVHTGASDRCRLSFRLARMTGRSSCSSTMLRSEHSRACSVGQRCDGRTRARDTRTHISMVGVYTCGLAVPMIDRNSFLRASSSLSFSTRSGRETGWSGRAARCSFSTRRGAPFYIDGANPTQPLVSSPCYLSSALTLEVKACARMLDGIKARAVVMPQMYPRGRLPGVRSPSCERRQMRLSGTAAACCCERKCVRTRAHPCVLACAHACLCARILARFCMRA